MAGAPPCPLGKLTQVTQARPVPDDRLPSNYIYFDNRSGRPCAGRASLPDLANADARGAVDAAFFTAAASAERSRRTAVHYRPTSRFSGSEPATSDEVVGVRRRRWRRDLTRGQQRGAQLRQRRRRRGNPGRLPAAACGVHRMPAVGDRRNISSFRDGLDRDAQHLRFPGVWLASLALDLVEQSLDRTDRIPLAPLGRDDAEVVVGRNREIEA